MTALLSIVFILIASAVAVFGDDFDSWKAKFDKFYWRSENEDAARQQFNKTLAYVTSYNTVFGTKTGFQMVLNQFSDLSEGQVSELTNGAKSVFTMVPLNVAAKPIVYGSYDAEFEDWKTDLDREYQLNGTEEIDRYGNFRKTRSTINSHNVDPGRSYEMGLNQFSDWTVDEFEQILLKSRIPIPNAKIMMTPEEDTSIYCDDIGSELAPKVGAESVDWRGMLGDAEYQGTKCGSCYSFSAVAALICRNNVKLIKRADNKTQPDTTWLSTQQVVDCSRGPGKNLGCAGGNPYFVFEYVGTVGGLNKESTYPYTGKTGKCRANKDDLNIQLKAPYVYQVPESNSDALQQALQDGCISFGMAIEQKTFMNYESGIYKPEGNCQEQCFHAMTLVGYTKDAWIVRNSWSSKWGENGHIRFDRKIDNMCGMLNELYYPALA